MSVKISPLLCLPALIFTAFSFNITSVFTRPIRAISSCSGKTPFAVGIVEIACNGFINGILVVYNAVYILSKLIFCNCEITLPV